MVKLFRHPRGGQVIAANAAAWSGVYPANPQEIPVPAFAVQPFFVTPVSNRVGDLVAVNPGVTSPVWAEVTVEIGTGLTPGTFSPRMPEGTSGVLVEAMVGQVVTARVTASVGTLSAIVVVSGGVTVVPVELPAPPSFPAALTSTQWTSYEVRDTAPYGRRAALVNANVPVPTGFELRYYSGPPPDTTEPGSTGALLTPGTLFTTTGSKQVGEVCVNRVWWKRTSDGIFGNPSNTITYSIIGATPDEEPEDLTDVSSVTSGSRFLANLTLSSARQRGFYCNGDMFFVIATNVSISSVAPASQQFNGAWINGLVHNWGGIARLSDGNTIDDRVLTPASSGVAITSVNWPEMGARSQGFDQRSGAGGSVAYEAKRNLDPGKTGAALVITSPCTLTKAISKGASLGTNSRTPLQETVNFTIVSSIPTVNSFRPSPAAASKASLFTESDLDYNALGSIGARPTGAPTPAAAYENIRRGWQVGCRLDDNSRHMAAVNNTWADFQMTDSRNGYGQFTGQAAISAALLCMCSDTTTLERRNLTVALVQMGLDIAAVISNGGKWHARGGILDGWKLPLFFAAMMLDDAGLKALCNGDNQDFAEDQHVFTVAQGDVNRAVTSPDPVNRPSRTYTQAMATASMPESGVQHYLEPHLDSSHIWAQYRNINSATQVGQALVAWLMDGKTVWNRDAFFNYVDRIMGVDPGNGTPTTASYCDWMAVVNNQQANAPPAWHRRLYRTFRTDFGARSWTSSTPPGGWPG